VQTSSSENVSYWHKTYLARTDSFLLADCSGEENASTDDQGPHHLLVDAFTIPDQRTHHLLFGPSQTLLDAFSRILPFRLFVALAAGLTTIRCYSSAFYWLVLASANRVSMISGVGLGIVATPDVAYLSLVVPVSWPLPKMQSLPVKSSLWGRLDPLPHRIVSPAVFSR
jgi:hypothetical protein